MTKEKIMKKTKVSYKGKKLLIESDGDFHRVTAVGKEWLTKSCGFFYRNGEKCEVSPELTVEDLKEIIYKKIVGVLQ